MNNQFFLNNLKHFLKTIDYRKIPALAFAVALSSSTSAPLFFS